MEAFAIYLKDREQTEAVKAFLKALKIPFKPLKTDPYDPVFVAKIKESEQQIKEGKVTRVTGSKELETFLGIDD